MQKNVELRTDGRCKGEIEDGNIIICFEPCLNLNGLRKMAAKVGKR